MSTSVDKLLNSLPQLPADSANHFMYGAIGFVGLDISLHLVPAPRQDLLILAMMGTVALAVLKKSLDHIVGVPMTSADLFLDICSQIAGGALCLVAALV